MVSRLAKRKVVIFEGHMDSLLFQVSVYVGSGPGFTNPIKDVYDNFCMLVLRCVLYSQYLCDCDLLKKENYVQWPRSVVITYLSHIKYFMAGCFDNRILISFQF